MLLLSRFQVSIRNIQETGFDAVIKRTDSSAGWGQDPILYWSKMEIPEDQKGLKFL